MVDKKMLLNGNLLKLSDFSGCLADYFSDDTFCINEIRLNRAYVDGKPSEKIEAVTYALTNERLHSNFNLKVMNAAPLLDVDEFSKRSEAGEEFYLTVDTSKVYVKPYGCNEFGIVKVSIVCEQTAVSLTD